MLRGLRMLVWGLGVLSAAYVVLNAATLPHRGSFGLRTRGETVMAVTPDGPAARAGIRASDRIPGLPPAVRGVARVVRVERSAAPGAPAFEAILIATAPDEAERARTGLALLLAAAFVVVAALVLLLRADRLVFAFALFAFSAAFALAPRPVVPAWLITGPLGQPLDLLALGASLLLPAALVDFFARFPEGRPGRMRLRLVVFGYTFAGFLFVLAVLSGLAEKAGPESTPFVRFLRAGSLEALAAVFFSGAIAAALFAFAASYRAAPVHHRPRLTVLLWAVLLGLAPLALLTFVKNVAPEVEWPAERWAALSLLLVPIGFGYAIVVHRVFDLGAVGAYGRGLLRRAGGRVPARTSTTGRAGAVGAGPFRPAPFASLASVLDEAAQELTQSLGLEHCAVFAVNGSGAVLSSLHGQTPRFGPGVALLDRLPQPVIEMLARAHAPLAVEEIARNQAGGEEPGALAPFGDLGTSLLVPLFSEDACRAVLALGPRLSGPWFDPAERERVAEFARQASVAVENAVLHDRLVERAALERDVQLARTIQQRLLPRAAPLLPTVDLAGVTVPAGEIGGDYYDFLTLGPRALGVAVADVCGKGLPAALLLAGVQAGLRSRADDDLSPARLLARLNDELAALDQPEKFVCLAYARLDARRRTLTWSNAGLNPPHVVHPDGSVEEVSHGGLILGVAAGQVYEDMEWTFERGSVVAFYSAGVTDSLRGHEPFGPERLAEALSRNRHLRAARIAERVLAESAEWHLDGAADDRTIAIIKFL